jgi:hypothetical protein
MPNQNPQIERTPTTLIIRHLQLPQKGWLAFGVLWLVPAGCIFLLVLLIGSLGFLAGSWESVFREILGPRPSGIYAISLILAVFIGVGVWMVKVGLQREHYEAQVWIFDKVSSTLIIGRQMRNRATKAVRIDQVATYPLPASGSVWARKIPTTEHTEQELVATVNATMIHRMRQGLLFGDLENVAREINDFLAASGNR